jgi:hypothetical protein
MTIEAKRTVKGKEDTASDESLASISSRFLHHANCRLLEVFALRLLSFWFLLFAISSIFISYAK